MTIDRRSFIQGSAAAGLGLAVPNLFAQNNEALRIGLLTVKTGPLASGGIDMELGLKQWLAENGNMLGGRKVELTVADTGGVPANTKTKISELNERNKVHVIMGPLAAFEALAVDDYIRDNKIPTLSVAAAEDMTQRKPNPWFVRATSTSSQSAHPMADYCANIKKYKRMVIAADDIAYGHEMAAGFQRVFEENGGKIVQRLFPPLTVPDYGSYLAQLKTSADAIFLGFAGSNGFRFIRQMNEYGLKGKIAIVGGMTALDEAVLKNMGDEALGIETACWYSAELNYPINNKFVPAFRKAQNYDPGFYAAATYVNAAVLDAALKSINGNLSNKDALMAALKKTNVPTARGPVSFDSYGNVVGDVYIRKVERKEGRLVNVVTKTYTNVSQFWKYDPKAFLANPVYSKDWPPAKNLE
jgi:branched-chain amino acid transport system substrate-binding protein